MEGVEENGKAVQLIPLTKNLVTQYCKIGREAYADHYLHLWPNKDPKPYFSRHLTPSGVSRDLNDPNLRHYLLEYMGKHIGILKVVLDVALKPYSAESALLIEKIYIVKSFTGRGVGTEVIKRVEQMARLHKKDIIWLDTMKTGPALAFYLKSGFKIAGEISLDIPEVLPDEKDMYLLVKPILKDF